MDVHRYKYQKYKNKNKGGNIGTALKALSMAKKGAKTGIKLAKKGADKGRQNALKVSQEIKKEIQDEDIKQLLGKDYNDINKNLDDIIKILSITSLDKLYQNKNLILEIANKINNIVQESKLNDDIKKQIDQVVSFANMINSD